MGDTGKQSRQTEVRRRQLLHPVGRGREEASARPRDPRSVGLDAKRLSFLGDLNGALDQPGLWRIQTRLYSVLRMLGAWPALCGCPCSTKMINDKLLVLHLRALIYKAHQVTKDRTGVQNKEANYVQQLHRALPFPGSCPQEPSAQTNCLGDKEEK